LRNASTVVKVGASLIEEFAVIARSPSFRHLGLWGREVQRVPGCSRAPLTNPRKLALLMALVALAIAWAGRTAADLLGSGSPKRKFHGRRAQSWFRTGFDRLRNLLGAGRDDALNAWRRLGKPGRKPRIWRES
jgi:hypothetical protein